MSLKFLIQNYIVCFQIHAVIWIGACGVGIVENINLSYSISVFNFFDVLGGVKYQKYLVFF